MRQVRKCVFETNSSSTHSLSICTKEEYDKWKSGDLIYDNWSEKLISVALMDNSRPRRYKTYRQFDNNEYLETYETEFTTPSGDKMVAFGEYGYDG